MMLNRSLLFRLLFPDPYFWRFNENTCSRAPSHLMQQKNMNIGHGKIQIIEFVMEILLQNDRGIGQQFLSFKIRINTVN